MNLAQRVPPMTANIGQACFKCFKDETQGINLQKCSRCRRVSYCGSGLICLTPNFRCLPNSFKLSLPESEFSAQVSMVLLNFFDRLIGRDIRACAKVFTTKSILLLSNTRRCSSYTESTTQKPFTVLSVFAFAMTSQPLKHSLGGHSTSSSETFLLGNLAAQHGSISYIRRDVFLMLTQRKHGS